MVTLNCTLKLSKRLPYSTVDVTLPTTNRLGDWCANTFNVGRYPYILITNEQTLLSVVVPLKDSVTLWPRFVLSLQSLLKSIGIADRLIDEELSHYAEVQLTRKTNRHTLGSMNDFVYQVKARVEIDGNPSLESIALDLSQIPCGPVRYFYPRDAVLELFAAAALEQ